MPVSPIRAITFDLDDTLWPFAPVVQGIREATEAWMAEHAPRTAGMFDAEASDLMAATVRTDRPDLAHDVGALKHEALRRMLAAAGEDPELAEAALTVSYDARQQVKLYADVAPALDRLAARVPLLALTNGNADVERTGVAHWFPQVVSAMEHGVGKPDARIFHHACERLGVAPAHVLHVGDDLHTDVGGALGAGLQAAWVHRDFAGEAPEGALRFADLTALADGIAPRLVAKA